MILLASFLIFVLIAIVCLQWAQQHTDRLIATARNVSAAEHTRLARLYGARAQVCIQQSVRHKRMARQIERFKIHTHWS